MDHDTGEIFPVRWVADGGLVVSGRRDHNSNLLERYALQSVVRRILPKSRTAKCHRLRQCSSGDVEIYRSRIHGATYYGNLQTCGSVWACQVCGSKIAERRRVELLAAIGYWKSQGGAVLLLTLTHPHTAGDSLQDLVSAEQRAINAFWGNKAGKRFKESIGCIGHVRAWEVTHGRLRLINNGWHPHFHVLLFLRGEIDMDRAEDQAYRVWAQACKLGGLEEPSRKHGVTLEDGDKAAAYVTKGDLEEPRENAPEKSATSASWGLDAEMTRGHTKRAKDGETPADLLRAILANPKDTQAERLWIEYHYAFKGKRQLLYSPGLRELLQMDRELSDEEMAAKLEDNGELLSLITPEQWRLVLKYDVRGEALILRGHSGEALERLLTSLGVA